MTVQIDRPLRPLTVCDELAQLLRDEDHKQRNARTSTSDPVALHVTLDELRGWLTDHRSYAHDPRRREWQSLAHDLKAAANTRGTRLQAVTGELDQLATQIHSGVGRDLSARSALLATLQRALTELGSNTAITAAFEDLHTAASNRRQTYRGLREKYAALHSTLHLAGRSLPALRFRLTGVLQDRISDIDYALHLLDGTPLEPGWRDQPAGLTVTDA